MANPHDDLYSVPSGRKIHAGRHVPSSSGAISSAQARDVASFAGIVSGTVSGAIAAAQAHGTAAFVGGATDPAGPPVAAGTWQQLTVAAHSRKVISTSSPPDSATFSVAPMLATDALVPQTVQAIPARGFNVWVRGEWQTLYMTGSLHSGYRGNEIDRMLMPVGASTVVSTTINHQPASPPSGPNSGYAAGMGGYIYKQSYAPEGFTGYTTQSEAASWMPFKGHNWTMASWSPYWGYFEVIAHAVQSSYPDGTYSIVSGVLQSSATQPTDDYTSGTRQVGAVGYDWTAAKYKTYLSQLQLTYPFNDQAYGLGTSGVTDWNNWDQTQLFFNSISGSLNILRWSPISGSTKLADMTAGTALSGIGSQDGHSGNGLLIRNLEQRKYLILRQNLSGRSGIGLFLYSEDFGAGNARIVNLTASLPTAPFSGAIATGDLLTYCVDKNSRRVFWLVEPGNALPIRLYVSTFEDLMAWTAITTINSVTWADADGGWLTLDRQPMHFMNGYLYLHTTGAGPNDPGYQQGAMNMMRVKVDAGEELPAMSFQRYDQRLQDSPYYPGTGYFTYSAAPFLTTWGTKHVNWAYRPVDGKHYQHAGDFGSSTCQSMATLTFDGTTRGYTFNQILDETTIAPTGKVRPAAPDDGHWTYIDSTCPDASMRDKFLWVRGGDGEPMFYDQFLRPPYGVSDAVGTISQVQAAIADRWDLSSKFYLFDPATTTFTPLGATRTADFSACTPPSAAGATFPVTNANGWTQDNGGTFFPDVWTVASAASRNGTYDVTTNTLWRFYDSGSPALASFNFTTKVVKFFNLATWASPETGRTIFLSGAAPTSPSQVIADGTKDKFCFLNPGDGRYVSPLAANWEHKATWIDTRDGKLYVVSPSTGYLWCFETRNITTTSGPDGARLAFYPLGKRVPLSGCFPTTDPWHQYPPIVATNRDVRMNSFLVPFKGGLLWWGSNHHDNGVFGHPSYAFWRRLGYTGEWTVVSFPQELAANTYSVVSRAIDNSEVVFISTAGNAIETPGPWPFFWRMT